MRHQGVIGPVACLEEESHASNQTEHCVLVERIQSTDGDQECTRNDGKAVEPCLLGPQGAIQFPVK